MSTDEQNPNPGRELAPVHYLPATQDQPSDVEASGGPVLEGEVLTAEQYRQLQKRKAHERWNGYRHDVVVVGRVAKTVATHQATKSTGRAVGRHVAYVFGGALLVGRQVWESKTNARYERMQRQAEARGDWDALKEWEERAEQARERRHRRRMDLLTAPAKLARAGLIAAVSVMGCLLALGVVLAIANKNPGDVIEPIMAVFTLVKWIAYAVTVAWLPLVMAAPWVVIAGLWWRGRQADAVPQWLRATKSKFDTTVTADGIVTALQHLGISPLNQAFRKDQWVPRFDLTPTREGQGTFKGYRAIFDLPLGVTADMISDKRDVLAKNLGRNAVEVWPSDYGKETNGKPGYVNLYVADAGVMDKPTPAYPLLTDGDADVFDGVPVGITQRGELVKFPLVGSNFVFGGQPGQGKSNAARVVMLGAALDPLAELRVHVFAGNGDFDEYAPRLARYHKGVTTEHVEAATEHLRELYQEVERRERRLAEVGAKKLTRAVSEQHADLRPLVVMFSECHELFGKSDEAAELAVNVVKRGRKTGVVCGFDTQSARANAIPSEVVENVGVNGCFAVKTWRSNDGFLGDGSFASGIRATELRFNVDRGTMVTTGVSDELFEIVRTFFIKVDDDTGWDAATDVIARAVTNMAPGTTTGGQLDPAQPAERDLFADLAHVLDGVTDRVPAGDLIGSLRSLAPNHKPYQDLTIPGLVAILANAGIKVPKTGNKWPVDPDTVRNHQAEREASGDDE